MGSGDVPRQLSVGGREWEGFVHDFRSTYSWKTPMRSDEYEWEPSDLPRGREIRYGEVPHYFVFINDDRNGSYTVWASKTAGPNSGTPGVALSQDNIISEKQPADSLADAVDLAKSMMQTLE